MTIEVIASLSLIALAVFGVLTVVFILIGFGALTMGPAGLSAGAFGLRCGLKKNRKLRPGRK